MSESNAFKLDNFEDRENLYSYIYDVSKMIIETKYLVEQFKLLGNTEGAKELKEIIKNTSKVQISAIEFLINCSAGHEDTVKFLLNYILDTEFKEEEYTNVINLAEKRNKKSALAGSTNRNTEPTLECDNYNINNIPMELQDKKAWVCVGENKVPITTHGYNSKPNDKKTWDTFDNCVNYYKKNTHVKGIGFMFSMDDNYVPIDIDNININTEEKQKFINNFNSYTELSQSKTGYHIIVKVSDKKKFEEWAKNNKLIGYGTPIKNTLSSKHGDYEIYIEKRYFWLTGNVVENKTEIKEISFDELKAIFEFIEGKRNKKNAALPMDDNKIIELASKATNGNKFLSLYNEVGQDGNSEGDLSLASILAFYTQDKAQIKNIMLNSPRYRDKFEKHPTYLDSTINKALNSVTNTYNPNFRDSTNKKELDIYEILNNINTFRGERTFDPNIEREESCNYYDLQENWGTGYYLNKHGFIQRKIIKIKIGEGKEAEKYDSYVDTRITPIVLIPNRIINVDNNQELELKGVLGNNEKILLTDNDTFSSISKFKTFLNSYFKTGAWFDGVIKDLTEYEKYIDIYTKNIGLTPIYAISKLGWTKDNNFNPYTGHEIFVKNNDNHSKDFLEGFNVVGNFDIWKKHIEKYNHNDIFRMIFNTSLASPIVSLIRRPPIWVHNYAKADSGKTPALFAAASIWAKPGKDCYTPAFNIRRVGLEFMWHTLGNLPCILDDSQNLDSNVRNNISDIIYDMFNGSGRIRGNIQGKNQQKKFWELCMITNGEQELLQGNEYEGAVKRLIEIEGKPFDDVFQAREAREIFQDNYGHYGKEYINTIVKHKDSIKKLCLDVEDIIKNNINMGTHIQNISTLVVCDYIFNVYCLNKDKNESFDSAIRWARRILPKLPKNSDVDKITLGIQFVKEYVISNKTRFDENCPYGQVGFFRNGNVYFFNKAFSKLLKEWHIPEKRFLDEIKKMEITDTDEKGYLKAIRYRGQLNRYIGFKLSLEEKENDYLHDERKGIQEF